MIQRLSGTKTFGGMDLQTSPQEAPRSLRYVVEPVTAEVSASGLDHDRRFEATAVDNDDYSPVLRCRAIFLISRSTSPALGESNGIFPISIRWQMTPTPHRSHLADIPADLNNPKEGMARERGGTSYR